MTRRGGVGSASPVSTRSSISTSARGSLRCMADSLDVVAVRISDKCGVIGAVVLGPQARPVKRLGAGGHPSVEERSYGPSVRRRERNVGLAESCPGGLRADPEVGLRMNAVPDDLAEVHHPGASYRREDGVVEAGAGSDVRALDGE